MESSSMCARRERVQRAVFVDMPAAFAERGHPGFHLTAPSHYLLDFWGTIYHDGFYHIFCHSCEQRGPFQQETVFFHARSSDLLHWTYLPVPIIANDSELRLNDGCLCVNGEGTPLMLYTSVPKDSRLPRAHCAAEGTADLTRFERIAENPFMTLDNHGGPAFGGGWSDPYVFSVQGRTFMLMSKCVDENGRHRLPIYEATDDTLLHWAYRGILFENNGEVVNFFPLDGKWVLIYSPYRTIEYFVGDFDLETLCFTPQTHGILSYGYHSQENPIDRGFYATCLYDRGAWTGERRVLCGWISGFTGSDLWNGCMGVPRDLRINARGELTQQPSREIESLRGEAMLALAQQPLESAAYHLRSNQLDIDLSYTLAESEILTLSLENADGSVPLSLTLRTDGFIVNGETYTGDAFCGAAEKHVRLLIDRTVAELFLGDGAVSATRCFDVLDEHPTLRLHASAPGVLNRLHVYPMRSITVDTCLE